MNEIIFLVADATMEAVFRAFFERDRFHQALKCRVFQIDPVQDIIHIPKQTDGGLHRRAHDLLRSYLKTHNRAIVVLDQQFGGEIPADVVRKGIIDNLNLNGWDGRCAVVVIEPELEAWLWQDNVNVEAAVRHIRPPSLRDYLLAEGEWPQDEWKPISPKESIQRVIRANHAGPHTLVYARIAKSVTVRGCLDPAFVHFARTLCDWFGAPAP